MRKSAKALKPEVRQRRHFPEQQRTAEVQRQVDAQT